MTKPSWLPRSLVTGPYVALCTTPAQFAAALKKLKCKEPVAFPSSGGLMEAFEGASGGLSCVVCIAGGKKRDPVQVVGLLVHEAVHVWQAFCDHIGETAPSAEFEAYSIQAIAMRLIEAYPNPKEKKHAKVNAR